MSRPLINPGKLHWSGEHWINYVREPGAETDSAMISLFHTRYSPAGEGTAAFVEIAMNPAYLGLYTDNPEMAAFVRNMIRGRGNPFDRELPLVPAEIYRTGDIRHDPAWVIHNDQTHMMVQWRDLQPPIVVEGDAPTFGPDRDFFTVLIFTGRSTITVDGQTIGGQPYQREIWQASIGGYRSSCVIALAETMILVGEKG
ncbi:MAG: hypothetical protein QNJ45_11745 [Ardenticatenaceae bacterium]|nr:hypothetical protein [Ardenticatenaceae bacterium]